MPEKISAAAHQGVTGYYFRKHGGTSTEINKAR